MFMASNGVVSMTKPVYTGLKVVELGLSHSGLRAQGLGLRDSGSWSVSCIFHVLETRPAPLTQPGHEKSEGSKDRPAKREDQEKYIYDGTNDPSEEALASSEKSVLLMQQIPTRCCKNAGTEDTTTRGKFTSHGPSRLPKPMERHAPTEILICFSVTMRRLSGTRARRGRFFVVE